MKKNGKFFVNVVCNLILVIVIFSIFSLTINNGSVRASSNTDINAIYRGNKDNNVASLMINVYWGNEYIESMLNTLKNNNVKTTFFVGGTWVEKYPDLFKKIVNDGHEIGNHGYFHKDHEYLSEEVNKQEIQATHSIVKSITAKDMTLFAPPSGSYSSTTLKVASDLGYKTIMWSRDTIDWRDKSQDLIYTRATKNISSGELVLMHPTECTAQVLDKIIKFYLSNGFSIVPVSENIL